MSYKGLQGFEGASFAISYHPSAQDNLSDKVYFVKIAFELKNNIVDFSQTQNVEIIEPYTGLDLRTGRLQSDVAVRLIQEFDGPSPRKIAPQTAEVLNRGGISNCQFASGLSSLPGVSIGQQVQSVLVHFDAETVNKSISTTVKFNRPIVALILSGYDLSLSNPIYGRAGVVYGNLLGSGMDSQDSIFVSSDRTSINISFNEVDAVDQIRVILESNINNLLDDKLMYYCPTKQEKRCNIICNYVNNDESVEKVHFRITFYANPEKTDIVLSTFTKYDTLNWQIGHDSEFEAEGLLVQPKESINVFYSPEVLPFDLFASQHTTEYSQELVRQGLLCGISYTVVLESYVNGEFYVLKESVFNCNCNDVEIDAVTSQKNNNDWICSANGFDDYLISDTDNVALYPKVITNITNFAYIVWQDYRYSRIADNQRAVSPDYFMGIYDFENRKFTCSGQGQSDTRLTFFADTEQTLFDHSIYIDGYQNLNIIYHDGFRVYWKSCTYGCRLNQIKTTKPDDDVDIARRACAFTDDSNNPLFAIGTAPDRASDQYQKIRLTKASVSYSTYLDNLTPIPVISDCLIELDIIGVPGTYAYRLRNEVDEEWSEWLPINSDLPEQNLRDAQISENPEENQNKLKQIKLQQDFFRAYFVEKDRFIAPWIASKDNGNKRICCEILTFFGKTNAFCLDFIARYEQLEYKIDLFFDANFSNPLPSINNIKVASLNKTGIPIKIDDLSSLNSSITKSDTIYVRLEFKNKEKIDIVDRLRRFDKYNLDFSMSVLQQGLNDQFNIPLEKIYNGVYRSSFKIFKNDGVYNKDGLAYIVLNLPNTCFSYDANIFRQIGKLQLYQNLEQQVSIFDNYTIFKDSYNADDPKYLFGNSDYYKQPKFNFSDDTKKYKRNSWIGGGEGQIGAKDAYDGRTDIGGGSGDNNGGGGNGDPEPPTSGGLPSIRPDGTISPEPDGGIVYPPWCNKFTGECQPPPVAGG
jgi:hypothetical protein